MLYGSMESLPEVELTVEIMQVTILEGVEPEVEEEAAEDEEEQVEEVVDEVEEEED